MYDENQRGIRLLTWSKNCHCFQTCVLCAVYCKLAHPADDVTYVPDIGQDGGHLVARELLLCDTGTVQDVLDLQGNIPLRQAQQENISPRLFQQDDLKEALQFIVE